MESSPTSWEATFSLSDTSREKALRNSRLRQHPSSMEKKRAAAPSTLPFDRKTATCLNSLKSSKTFEDDKGTHVAAEPISNKTKHLRKTAALTLKAADCDHNALPSTPTDNLNKELHRRGRHSPCLCSENVLNDGVHEVNAPSFTQTSFSLSTHSSQKRIKTQMEIVSSDFDYEKLPARLEADFFQCDSLELAPKLLGKFLRRDDVVLQITEVEAYRPNDSACHARFGITPRTAAMFGPGGHAYVYLCYGLHVMLNIVADIKGVGAAVLIRSCAPIAGLQTIQSRRGIVSSKPILLTGPGKIGQALGLTTDWTSHPLYTAGGLELLDGPATENILAGPRVGINYANPEDVTALWRFAIAGTPWISAPRRFKGIFPLQYECKIAVWARADPPSGQRCHRARMRFE
ncbi:hypothetical protein GOP47_0013168 [Adiantum capillus-veneris]|uniref:DNA-3-methyladenine glycosylase II n=1 Tax=Adiantum capillus-veneris TaxID=13818 RepID=A0A9D4UNY4_ADICA|nr:hypothetical protein GOP47_0013168 [Adiantum capillus-veneris]